MNTQLNGLTKPKISPSKKEIIQKMEDFDTSESVTVKEFCEMHDIDATTFREWHYIFENRHEQNERSGFVSLDVQGPEKRQPIPSPLFAEVGGIRIYQQVSAEYLKSLLP